MARRLFLSTMLVISAGLAAGPGTARAEKAPVAIVFFAEWSGAMDDAAAGIVRQEAEAAQKAPGSIVTVTGYADRKGSTKANIYLSQLRAQVVSDALVAQGVPEGRIAIVARGELPLSGVIGRRVEITLGGAS